MLQRHYDAPECTVTPRRLAEQVGYVGGGGVNLQYGHLAARLGRTIRFRPERCEAVFVLSTFERRDEIENGEVLLVMRPQLAKALEILGWVW